MAALAVITAFAAPAHAQDALLPENVLLDTRSRDAGDTTIPVSSVAALTAGREYLITVAWQGMAPIQAPPDSVPCGETLYDGPAGSPCVNDLCRRVVTTVVRISDLAP